MQATNAEPARVLRTPPAAAAAGVLFALLLTAAIVLIRIATSGQPESANGWLASASHRDTLRAALDLVPFAGVFCLWFMGAVRSHVSHQGDRFFDTLFLGSGTVFIATVFVLAASTEGLVNIAGSAHPAGQLQQWLFGSHLTLTLLSSYSMRMAAVFTLCTTTIGHHLGVFPRWLTWLGYLVGLVLLFVVSSVPWSELVFPGWVLALSCHILRSTARTPHARTDP